ncbi:MAG TPA: hypothetical protein VGB87_04950 [Vicinamibacteria bacterium]
MVALGGGPGETGSASQWVEVPDLAAGRLALSSLFLAAARTEDGPAGGPLAPRLPEGAARRSFPAGSEVDVVLFAYNAKGDEAGRPDLAVRIQLRADGRLVHEFQPRPMRADDPGAPRRVPAGARLSLAGLPPGDYEMRAVVEDRRAGAAAERSVAFTVE